MNRMEIAAWVQVVVGIAALLLTALTAAPILEAAFQASTDARLPTDDRNAQSAIQLFAVILVMATALVLVAIGVAVILGQLFSLIRASSPYHAAFCVVVAMLLIAGGATIALMGSTYAVWFLLQAGLCLILAGQAQVDPNKETFWSLMIIGTVICFVAGMTISGLFSGTPLVPEEPPVAVTEIPSATVPATP